MPRKLGIENKYTEAVLNLAFDTIKIGKQAFIFVNTKRSAEKAAEEIAKKSAMKLKSKLLRARLLIRY